MIRPANRLNYFINSYIYSLTRDHSETYSEQEKTIIDVSLHHTDRQRHLRKGGGDPSPRRIRLLGALSHPFGMFCSAWSAAKDGAMITSCSSVQVKGDMSCLGNLVLPFRRWRCFDLLNSYSLNSNAIFWNHSAQGKYYVCATAESSGRRPLLINFPFHKLLDSSYQGMCGTAIN